MDSLPDTRKGKDLLDSLGGTREAGKDCLDNLEGTRDPKRTKWTACEVSGGTREAGKDHLDSFRGTKEAAMVILMLPVDGGKKQQED